MPAARSQRLSVAPVPIVGITSAPGHMAAVRLSTVPSKAGSSGEGGLPNGSPEYRYAYHELIEEGQHSLMFQEFVNRTGLETPGLPTPIRFAARFVAAQGRLFPPLFFVFVLGGEDPIDHVQRTTLRSGRELHPLLRRIMQIHVTEEARHICFARYYLPFRHNRNGDSIPGDVVRIVVAAPECDLSATFAWQRAQPIVR